MRWNVSLTTPPLRDDTRGWTDIAAAVTTALDFAGCLQRPVVGRDTCGGMRVDAVLDAPSAVHAYCRATRAAALACAAAGIAVSAWSTVLVVSRPGSRTPGWRERDSAGRPTESSG